MNAVTLDFARARRLCCQPSRSTRPLKREAHRRVRSAWRAWLRDPDRDPPCVRPVTGWDLV